MDTKKVNTGAHEAQDPHDASDCQINEAPHNHPDMDCGHYVNEGPGTVQSGDKNVYNEDYGKESILVGSSFDAGDDVEHGPGVK
jgi:hypothetical protein